MAIEAAGRPKSLIKAVEHLFEPLALKIGVDDSLNAVEQLSR